MLVKEFALSPLQLSQEVTHGPSLLAEGITA